MYCVLIEIRRNLWFLLFFSSFFLYKPNWAHIGIKKLFENSHNTIIEISGRLLQHDIMIYESVNWYWIFHAIIAFVLVLMFVLLLIFFLCGIKIASIYRLQPYVWIKGGSYLALNRTSSKYICINSFIAIA